MFDTFQMPEKYSPDKCKPSICLAYFSSVIQGKEEMDKIVENKCNSGGLQLHKMQIIPKQFR
jgi:hypothetical protein